jgi:hypothetical protein
MGDFQASAGSADAGTAPVRAESSARSASSLSRARWPPRISMVWAELLSSRALADCPVLQVPGPAGVVCDRQHRSA